MIAFERLGGDLYAAAADGAVILGQRLAQLGPFEPGADIELDAPVGFEQIEALGGERVENNDARHGGMVACGMGIVDCRRKAGGETLYCSRAGERREAAGRGAFVA